MLGGFVNPNRGVNWVYSDYLDSLERQVRDLRQENRELKDKLKRADPYRLHQ